MLNFYIATFDLTLQIKIRHLTSKILLIRFHTRLSYYLISFTDALYLKNIEIYEIFYSSYDIT